MEQFLRTEMLIGKEAVKKLNNSKVIIFGVGGVGGHLALSLARSGVGNITLVDKDKVSVSNINRQAVAFLSTVGKFKCDVMKNMILDINPNASVTVINEFFLPENKNDYDFSQYDYIIDAVDTVSAKIALVECAEKSKVPIISAMGAGNKLDPTAFSVTDIFKTSGCPLARVMRRELKARGIKKLKVVYSTEKAKKPLFNDESDSKRVSPASIAFVPSVAGLIMAGEVVKDIVSQP